MSLIKLKDIGKIYVSEGNVSVGIRGVNLEFDKGEFVAITGESGSGKSTLLNVISGMDTYEEGELFIEGEPTSHYIQYDWEEYREKYISFIFQNYNIIDSFTVLQNVELSLMSIENPKERRKKALELIDRVGLTSHIRHKGSKLSGGQKQRTVIARALAKDSPIILADEPTGNLDSKSSREIIELLHEVSKDKLVIVVTHNADEVKDFATRQIRIFDGKVDFDKKLSDNLNCDIIVEEKKPENKKSNTFKSDLRNGFKLGRIIFTSKPKLSLYLCLLMIIGSIAVFFSTVTRLTGTTYVNENVFTHIDGRVVISKQNGELITDSELETLANETNAISTMHYDLLLDNLSLNWVSYFQNSYEESLYYDFEFVYNKTYGNSIIGRYPEKANEVFLYLPIYERENFGENDIITNEIYINDCKFDIVGLKYFYDNRENPKIVLTEDGFKICTALKNLGISNYGIKFEHYDFGELISNPCPYYLASFDLPEDTIYVNKEYYLNGNIINETSMATFSVSYNVKYNEFGEYEGNIYTEEYNYLYFTTDKSYIKDSYTRKHSDKYLVFNPNVLLELSNNILEISYKQASLFYENDAKAEKALDEISNRGYFALLSNTKTRISGAEALLLMIVNAFSFIGWFISILFIALFINLCSKKSILVFKEDIAIMRSMGIQSKIIKVAVYVRMIFSTIVGVVAIIGASIFIYVNPIGNMLFSFISYSNYIYMIIGLFILTILVTRKQIKNLFTNSVRVTLRGGAN